MSIRLFVGVCCREPALDEQGPSNTGVPLDLILGDTGNTEVLSTQM